MIKLIPMVFLLTTAALIHFMDPFSFINAIPLLIPFKLELIYFTGVIELLLAMGLAFKKTRARASKLTALYFIALIPIHVYVSYFAIPMFGVSDPVLLWSRTVFQFVLIFWAHSLRKV